MNEKEMLMKQLRANAFPHNNGKVMQAINIIRHSYNRLTDVQQAAQIWGVSQDDFLDCINYLAMAKYIQLRTIADKILSSRLCRHRLGFAGSQTHRRGNQRSVSQNQGRNDRGVI